MFYDENANQNQKKSEDIKKTPEEGAKRRGSPFPEEDIEVIDGRDIVIHSEIWVMRDDGTMVRQRRRYRETAADGRWLAMDEFVARSYTGRIVPRDRFGYCCNPYGLHEERTVYISFDGLITENGNILCGECSEWYEKKLRLERWTLGLLYRAERL